MDYPGLPLFQTEKRVYFSGGLSVHLASVWGEGNEHVRCLAGVLQQPWCWVLSRSLGGNARFLHWVGNQHFQRRSVLSGGFDEISPAGYVESKRWPGVVRPSRGGLWNVENTVVRDLSLVFCWKHKAVKTKIRLYKLKLCQNVLAYNANALYPSTILGNMPCGKEVVVHWPQEPGNIEIFCKKNGLAFWSGQWGPQRVVGDFWRNATAFL